jgi:molybdopterin-containing oxidoreductase family iron-sulfur binding subunit
MKDSKKIYWKGIEQLANNPDFVKNAHKEFPEAPEEDPGHSRRDFLKMMGFGMAAVSLAACEAPIRKAIPYVNKPIDIDPSIANYYASTYINGGDYCSIVVKTREGRPIKIDGNALSNITKGGTSAQVEASVLSLYDNSRLRGPKAGGKKISWEDLDAQVTSKLAEISGKGGQIRIVSNTILSPSTKSAIEKFKAKFPTTQVVQYDQTSHYGMLKANEESFGKAMIPSYDFSKANTIVSIAADFLNNWGSSIENNKQYGKTREVSEAKKDMSRHYHFESILTISGANADYRTQIKPSEEGAVAIQLYNLIAKKAGRSEISGGVDKQYLAQAADDLWANRGKSLVVAGSNDKAIQVIANAINDMLGSYGSTILPGQPVNFRQGDDQAMATLVSDLEGGKIDGIIFFNANPVYDHPMGGKIGAALKNISLAVATSYKEEETGLLTNYLAPDHHFLESWNDAEPKPGSYSLSQPAITPIFKSRAAQESLLKWAGDANADYFEYVKSNWKNWFYKDQAIDFQLFWDKCLYDGVYETTPAGSTAVTFAGNVNEAASSIASNYKSEGVELVIYENGTVGNGSQSNNPLLQELPDPITKAVWEHYVTVSPKDATGISFQESKTKFASISANGKTIKLPVLVQPGQTPGTIGIALGYGRAIEVGKVAASAGGQNVYPMIGVTNGSLSYNVTNVKFDITDESYQIAQTQTHNTYMGRETVIQETSLKDFKDESYKKDKYEPQIHTWTSETHETDPEKLTMWKNHEYRNHHWGMAIDLNTCTGCGACVVACNVENNIALVGRDEVINRREMHRLRIDRYYSSSASIDDWKGLENAADNPEVVFQPMLCQHCNNAPCETVCPVAATTHSTEGINQMTYNRCIGTRYCANNCPYKVRRFNWFKYHDNSAFENVNTSMNTDLGKMVLNPDVTVRSRGVMEKCSFCIQRIQVGKLNAKKEKRRPKDGEIVTACQAACSTGAIVFGDMNDAESKVSKLLQIKPLYEDRPYVNDKEAMNPRAYAVLEEINVRPNIFYLTKVRNKEQGNA